MKNYYFSVKFGFRPNEKVRITQDELEKALYAQKFGIVVQLGDKQISGKYIISIEKDVYYYTGWYDSYYPQTGEDFLQIERDCPKEIDSIIKNKREKIDYLIKTKQLHLIGKNAEISNFDRIETPKQDTELIEKKNAKVETLSEKFKIKKL